MVKNIFYFNKNGIDRSFFLRMRYNHGNRYKKVKSATVFRCNNHNLIDYTDILTTYVSKRIILCLILATALALVLVYPVSAYYPQFEGYYYDDDTSLTYSGPGVLEMCNLQNPGQNGCQYLYDLGYPKYWYCDNSDFTNYSVPFGDGTSPATCYLKQTKTVRGTSYLIGHLYGWGNEYAVYWNHFSSYRPNASFSYSPAGGGPAPLTVYLNDTSTNTSSVTHFTWNFGDGQTQEGNWPNPVNPVNVTYTTAGNYTINYTLTFPYRTSEATQTIQVVTAPIADFTGTPTSGSAPMTVQFTDTSTGFPTSWSWTFGDGGNSSLQNPSYMYTSAGTYPVSLAVTCGGGSNTTTKAGYVMVTGQSAQFTYSVTYIEDYPGNRSLYPYGNNALATVNYYLNSTEGWPLVFAKGNSEVTREDLGTQGGGLNNAVFHYHFSHGGRLLPEGNTVLELSNDNFVYPQDVQNMWGRNNKWTYIDSCMILDDLSWGGALNTSHGIFGYETEVGSKSTIWSIRDFFDNAIYSNKTLLLSYENASCYGVQYSDFKNVTGAAIFRNEQQASGDHLPGHGTIESDAFPSDPRWETNWSC